MCVCINAIVQMVKPMSFLQFWHANVCRYRIDYRIIHLHRFIFVRHQPSTLLTILFSCELLLLLILLFHWRCQMWKCVLCRKGNENKRKMRRQRRKMNHRTINKKSNSHENWFVFDGEELLNSRVTNFIQFNFILAIFFWLFLFSSLLFSHFHFYVSDDRRQKLQTKSP